MDRSEDGLSKDDIDLKLELESDTSVAVVEDEVDNEELMNDSERRSFTWIICSSLKSVKYNIHLRSGYTKIDEMIRHAPNFRRIQKQSNTI